MEIIELINNVGFPIAMVIYFIYDKNKSTDKVLDAINNNSIVLAKLLEKLDMIGISIKDGETCGE